MMFAIFGDSRTVRIIEVGILYDVCHFWGQ